MLDYRHTGIAEDDAQLLADTCAIFPFAALLARLEAQAMAQDAISISVS